MLRVRRSVMGALVLTVIATGAAWGAACQTSDGPEFPETRAPDEIRAWIQRETDLDPEAVVAVTPSAVTAILSYMSTPEGLQRVNLRSEATSAEAYTKDGVLSWTSVVEINCKARKARLGRTMAYADRNLVGDGRETVVASPGWITPISGGAAFNAMRKVCGGKIINPLNAARPVQVAQAAPTPRPAQMAQAAPAPRLAQMAQAAPAPAPVPVAAPPPPRVETPPPAPPPAPPPSSKPRGAPPPPSAIVVAPTAKVTSTHPVTFAAAEPAPAAAPAAPVSPGRVSVQISASLTPGEAKQSLAAAETRAGGLPPGVTARSTKAVVRGRTWFRAQFTGFQTPGEAQNFCRAAGAQGCLVKVNPGAQR